MSAIWTQQLGEDNGTIVKIHHHMLKSCRKSSQISHTLPHNYNEKKNFSILEIVESL